MTDRPITPILACFILLFSCGAQAEPLLGFYDNQKQNNTPAREAWLNRSIMLAWNYGTTAYFTGKAAPHWHMQPMVDWLNARPGRQLVYTVSMFRDSSPGKSNQTLAGCAAGAYDADYVNVAKAFDQFGIRSNIFRIGHEFSGNWYSWRSAGHEADYAACYRHIVDVLRATVPSNQWTFDWNPIADTKAATLAATYPGDAYVDYVTVDIYDSSRNVTSAYPYPPSCDDTCRLARQTANWNNILYQMNQIKLFGQSHGKKFGITEWGLWLESGESNTPGGGDDPYFIRQMHGYIANPVNNVAYSVYFEDANRKLCCSISETKFPKSSVLFQKLFGPAPAPAPAAPAAPAPAPMALVSAALSQATFVQGGTESVTVTISSNVTLANGKLSLDLRDAKGSRVVHSVTAVTVNPTSSNVLKGILKIPATVPVGSYFITMSLYDSAYKSQLYVNKIGTVSVTSP